MDNYKDAADLTQLISPNIPVFCARPHAAQRAARWFLENFQGESFYAVKANPSPWLLDALYAAGIRKFEVASIEEVRQVATAFPEAEIAFMHPVKGREAIREAYHKYGVRIFALDCDHEFNKIIQATGAAADLTLCLRHKVTNEHARIALSQKFGASGDEAVALLQRMRQAALRLGVAFHVGSQSLSPSAYAEAIDQVEKTIVSAGVIVDVLDIGGGFPAPYPDIECPPLEDYFAVIHQRFKRLMVAENCALWCEPGRALSAEASSLIVLVEGRRGDHLYINDGVYGALFDAGHLGWAYPAQKLNARTTPVEVTGFSFFGPTCDDIDYMPGPFFLPADVAEGDYIEIGMLGAYGAAMRTRFNGFGAHLEALVADGPMLSAYGPHAEPRENEKELHHVG